MTNLQFRLVYLLVTIHILLQWGYLPFWVITVGTVFVVWRWLADLFHVRTPGRWMVPIIAILGSIAVYFEFDTLMSLEASACLLALMMGLKTFEVRGYRDLMVVTPLTLMLLMVRLLETQSLLTTIFLVGDIAMIVYLLYFFHSSGSFSSVSITRILKLFVQALPVFLVMFMVFPRVNLGLFARPEKGEGQMGFSEVLKPGDVSRLVRSDAVAFRAFFPDQIAPPVRNLYWRGATLGRGDELNWQREEDEGAPYGRRLPSPRDSLNSVRVVLEPGQSGWLFHLEWVDDAWFEAPARQMHLLKFSDKSFKVQRVAMGQEEYRFTYQPFVSSEYWRGEVPDVSTNVPSPDARSLRWRDLVREIRGSQSSTDSDKVNRLERWFLRQRFVYSLTPPQMTNAEELLFEHQEGFCEHYAGAVVSILRASSVPARVVVGYHGGELSLMKDYVIVRQRDAHAWVEYWNKERAKWMRIDPTAWVAEERIQLGADEFYRRSFEGFASQGAPQWVEKFFGEQMSQWLARSRLAIDQLEVGWVSFLLKYDFNYQKALLENLGIQNISRKKLYGLAIILLAVTFFGVVYLTSLQRSRARPESLPWRNLEVRLRKLGVPRAQGEGPMEYALRIKQHHPEIWAESEDIFRGAIEIQYGPEPSLTQILEMRRRVGGLKLPSSLLTDRRKSS